MNLTEKIKNAERQIQELKSKNEKLHFTEFNFKAETFFINFLEIMNDTGIPKANCKKFSDISLPIEASMFPTALRYAEIYIDIIKEKHNIHSV